LHEKSACFFSKSYDACGFHGLAGICFLCTEKDGSYSITVPNNSTLQVSFVGYDEQEVKVGESSMLNIVLQASQSALQTVVVTGYGSQERRSITGSVAVVDTKEMTKFAASNIADQLQGKVPGVQMSTSGDPGSAAFVRIRGIGTINNNEPLYVIDGVMQLLDLMEETT